MTNQPVAIVKDLVKELGEGAGKVRAVDNVTLSIRAGELTLLMGPSGSGKTTLISLIGCILSPTAGEIILGGANTRGMTAEQLADVRRQHIGFVFQSYNLFPTLNATENVRLALDVRGIRGSASKPLAEEALAAVGLSHRLTSYPKQMSGGEQQRVAIARSLAGSPSIVLADEPTAALDSENGHAVMALLANVAHKRDRAVLAVTHDPRTLSYADRILRIEDGRIIDDEPGAAIANSVSQQFKKSRNRLDA